MDEVRNGLYYFETTLYDLAPEVRGARSSARSRAHYPGPAFPVPRSCASRAGSAATATATRTSRRRVTEAALRAHHELALRLLRRGIERLHGHLSTTERAGRHRGAAARAWRRTRRAFPEEVTPRRGALPAPALSPEAALRLPQARRHARGERPALARRPLPPAGHLPRRRGAARRPAAAAGEPARPPRRAARRRAGSGTLRAPGRDLRLPPGEPRPAAAQRTATRRRSPRCSAATGSAPSTTRRSPRSERARAARRARSWPGAPVRAAPARLLRSETNETLELFRVVRRAHERLGPARGRELRRQHDARAERRARGRCCWPSDAGVADGSTSCRCSRPWPTCTRRPRRIEQALREPRLRPRTSRRAAAARP